MKTVKLKNSEIQLIRYALLKFRGNPSGQPYLNQINAILPKLGISLDETTWIDKEPSTFTSMKWR